VPHEVRNLGRTPVLLDRVVAAVRPRPNGALLLQERFDGPARAVPLFGRTQMSYQHSEGSGQLTGLVPGILPAMYQEPHAKDFFAEFSLRAPLAGDNSCGLLFRSADVQKGALAHYYALFLYPGKNVVALELWNKGRLSVVKQVSLRSGMGSAPSHLVRLETVGSTFRVFHNHVFVAEFTDTTLAAPGLFGLCLSHSDGRAATVWFDSVGIYEPAGSR
jgi:hypothetical protein